MQQLLHTPEGVRDYYNGECAAKLVTGSKLAHVFGLYGFQSIQTPTFEYFDIFNAERGSVASKEMYKFFDRDGETMVLRPDFTPSIARCAAKYFGQEKLPIRLCYQGNIYINNLSYQGRLKESTQAGAELIGDDSLAADAEMLAMVVDCLKSVGLTEFQVEVGQVDFFNGLMEEAGLAEDQIRELRSLIESKNRFGVELMLNELSLSEDLIAAISALPRLFGSAEQVFPEARRLTENPLALAAVTRLEKIYELMKAYGMDKYISFDLGMLGNYRYYTGIIFKGYTYGTGDCIVTGGRYDNLMAQFGKDAPSIGFGIAVDTLMSALMRQKICVPVEDGGILLVYEKEHLERAIRLAGSYRTAGIRVSMMEDLDDAECMIRYAKENHISEILILDMAADAVRTVWKREAI
ncbi:MAG: ATP phosphoribosyltransferase regulatory subunit [Lachnospiraceae bacterium]|mgnify:FL=1